MKFNLSAFADTVNISNRAGGYMGQVCGVALIENKAPVIFQIPRFFCFLNSGEISIICPVSVPGRALSLIKS